MNNSFYQPPHHLPRTRAQLQSTLGGIAKSAHLINIQDARERTEKEFEGIIARESKREQQLLEYKMYRKIKKQTK